MSYYYRIWFYQYLPSKFFEVQLYLRNFNNPCVPPPSIVPYYISRLAHASHRHNTRTYTRRRMRCKILIFRRSVVVRHKYPHTPTPPPSSFVPPPSRVREAVSLVFHPLHFSRNSLILNLLCVSRAHIHALPYSRISWAVVLMLRGIVVSVIKQHSGATKV